MRTKSRPVGLVSTLILAAVVTVMAGCNSSRSSGGSESAAPVKEGKAKVQEAKTMEGHGEQLKAQGDETGGQQLIEQAKVKEAEGKTQIEQRGRPATKAQ